MQSATGFEKIFSDEQHTGKDTGMTEAQQKAADVNADGSINAIDATWILRYAADGGTGTAPESLADYIEKR